MNIQDWLNEPPLDCNVKIKDGGKYIPYEIIVEQLYQLCGNEWSTSDFKHLYYTLPNKRVLVSGEINLTVRYFSGSNDITRTLSGAATFVLNKASNPHPAATVKSLSIMNAVKPLGLKFGWKLNDNEDNVEPQYEVEDETEPSREDDRIKILINDSTSIDDLGKLRKNVPAELMPVYMNKLKELTKKM